MLKFFGDDGRHFNSEFLAIDVRTYEAHGSGCCFVLAVCMIDQYFLKMLVDLTKPTGLGIAFKMQHTLLEMSYLG